MLRYAGYFRGKVLKRVFRLRQELCAFLAQHKHPMVINLQDNFWLAKLSYLCFIFKKNKSVKFVAARKEI